jgi:hypothetical protein
MLVHATSLALPLALLMSSAVAPAAAFEVGPHKNFELKPRWLQDGAAARHRRSKRASSSKCKSKPRKPASNAATPIVSNGTALTSTKKKHKSSTKKYDWTDYSTTACS